MIKKWCSCLFIVMLFMGIASYGQSNFMSVNEVKPGMKGEGFTVLKGSEVESFPIEVIGVLKNSLGPKMDVIVVKLLGEKANRTGVVSGMSGSPIYIDGKLIGALAYRIGFFAKEPIGAVTPIEYMLKIKEKGRSSGASPLALLWSEKLTHLHPLETMMLKQREKLKKVTFPFFIGSENFKPIETPLGFSGFHPAVINNFAKLFQSNGFVVSQAGTSTGKDTAPLKPGSSIAVQLIRGDMSLSASGTVTYIDNNYVYAFGHPVLQSGQIEMPIVKSQVLYVFPSLSSSFKISKSAEEIGTLLQDRSSGVYGLLGKKPKVIPVSVDVKHGNQLIETFKFEIISDRLLSPLLLNLSVQNAIYSAEKTIGESTLQIKGKIIVSQKPEVNISNMFTGETAADTISRYAAAILYYLNNNPYEKIKVENIDLSIDYYNERKTATIERAWFSRDEVRKGDRITLFVLIKAYRGKTILKEAQLRIPPALSPGKINVLVADNVIINQEESKYFQGRFIPKDLNHLIKLLNSVRSAYNIYADFSRPDSGLIVKGQFMPALPPSLLSVYDNQQTPGDLIRLDYNLLDEEKIETEYIIRGSKKLSLTIKE